MDSLYTTYRASIYTNVCMNVMNNISVADMSVLPPKVMADATSDIVRILLEDCPVDSAPAVIALVLKLSKGVILDSNRLEPVSSCGGIISTTHNLTTPQDVRDIVKMVATLQGVSHPYIEQFLGVDASGCRVTIETFRPTTTLRTTRPSPTEIEGQLRSALDHLHSRNIIHGNITLDSIYYDNHTAMLGDFSNARICISNDFETLKQRDCQSLTNTLSEL